MPPFVSTLGSQMTDNTYSEQNRSESPTSSRSSGFRDDESFTQEASPSAGIDDIFYPAQHRRTLLPGFEPSSIDIILGRGKAVNTHNEAFIRFVRSHTAQYLKAASLERSSIVQSILAICRQNGSLFVKKIKGTDLWEEIGDKEAKRKISHAVRDRLTEEGRPVKGGTGSGQPSENDDKSDASSEKQISKRGNKSGQKKKESKKGDSLNSKIGPLKHSKTPTRFQNDTDTLAADWIQSSSSMGLSSNNLAIPNEMFPGQQLNNDSFRTQSGVQSPGIISCHSNGVDITTMPLGVNSASIVDIVGMLAPSMAMRPDVYCNTGTAQPERMRSQPQPIQQYAHSMNMPAFNTNNTQDSSYSAAMPIVQGSRINGAMTTNNSFIMMNDPLSQVAHSVSLRQQQETQQYAPYNVMSSMHMSVVNNGSYLPYNAIIAPARSSTSDSVRQARMPPLQPLFDMPLALVDHPLVPPPSVSEEPGPHDQPVNIDGLDLPFYQAFEQDIDIDQDVDDGGESKTDLDDGDLFPYPFLENDEEPEPL